MCRLRNIAMRDYQESVTTGQTDRQTDAGQSDPYVPLCFAGNTTRCPPIPFRGNKNNSSLTDLYEFLPLTDQCYSYFSMSSFLPWLHLIQLKLV